MQIPVTLLSRSGDVALTTYDVSFRGLFVRTAQPPAKMELLRLRMAVPTQKEEISANAFVTNVTEAGARVQGVGVTFYGFDGEPRLQWERFIQSVRDNHPVASEGAQPPEPAPSPGELVVAVASMPAFERLARDLTRGAVVIHAAARLRVDDPVSIRVVHPVTNDDLRIDGVVRRCLGGGGVSVSLRPMDGGTRSRLDEFVGTSSDDAIEIVDFESAPPPMMATPAPMP
jgi:hypothetical protein